MGEYKRFAEKRNAATKRCRAKGNAERKFLKEENARLREEIELLRVEGGLGDLYWRDKAEELRKELKGQIQFDDLSCYECPMKYHFVSYRDGQPADQEDVENILSREGAGRLQAKRQPRTHQHCHFVFHVGGQRILQRCLH